jgi:hypothetical protein
MFLGKIPTGDRAQVTFRYYALRLGALLGLSGFLGLPSPIRTLLLRFVMRMRFLVVVAALATEKEQDFLSVARTHTVSVGGWKRAVKYTAMRI